MLTEIQYAEQQRGLGHRIHEHDGVYWEEIYPFYCKPAFIYKPFDRGKAKPPRFCSLLGYDHQVCHPEQGNRWRPLMVLDRNQLDDFDLLKLSSKKRNQVRRGLEHCAVTPITEIDMHLERMLEINISQAIRQENGAGANATSSRYIAEAEEWRQRTRSEFALTGWEWWGAFVDGVLAAYLRTYQVDGIRIFYMTKADTAFLKFYPMDALYFAVLLEAASDPSCERIINGRPMHPSLNHFKEEFLFRAIEYPCFFSRARFTEMAKRLMYGKAALVKSASGT
jgi:hypothetical protein